MINKRMKRAINICFIATRFMEFGLIVHIFTFLTFSLFPNSFFLHSSFTCHPPYIYASRMSCQKMRVLSIFNRLNETLKSCIFIYSDYEDAIHHEVNYFYFTLRNVSVFLMRDCHGNARIRSRGGCRRVMIRFALD